MPISVRLLKKSLTTVSDKDLLAAYVAGLTFKDIATQLRCSESAVRDRLHSIPEFVPRGAHRVPSPPIEEVPIKKALREDRRAGWKPPPKEKP